MTFSHLKTSAGELALYRFEIRSFFFLLLLVLDATSRLVNHNLKLSHFQFWSVFWSNKTHNLNVNKAPCENVAAMAAKKSLSFMFWFQNIIYIYISKKPQSFKKKSLSFQNYTPKTREGVKGKFLTLIEGESQDYFTSYSPECEMIASFHKVQTPNVSSCWEIFKNVMTLKKIILKPKINLE